MNWWQEKGGVLILRLHCQPGANHDRIAGVHADRLKIRLATPPVDGKANQRLQSFLAREFGVKRRSVHILSGQRSRDKRVSITQPITLPVWFEVLTTSQ